MPITTTLDQVRLHLGDTDETRPLFNDDELEFLLSERGDNVLLTAADACDILATRFARDYDFRWKDSAFNRSQMAQMYAARAKALRARVNGGLAVVQTTRVDGASEDVSHRDGAGQASPAHGRVRAGYYDGDEIPS